MCGEVGPIYGRCSVLGVRLGLALGCGLLGGGLFLGFSLAVVSCRRLLGEGAVLLKPAHQTVLHQVIHHGLTQALGIDLGVGGELFLHLLDLGVHILVVELDVLRFRQGGEGKTAAQTLFGLGA